MFESTIICGQIYLGKQGEHNARRFTFNDVKIWQELFGEGHCEVLHQRNGDSAPYPVVLTIEDGVPYWYVSEVDTAIAGEGKCEIRYIVNDAIVKSSIYVTVVQESLGEGAEEPPEAAKPWVDQVIEAAEKVLDATKDVEDIKTDIEKVKKDVSDANEISKQTIEQLEEATTKAKNEIDTVTKESKEQIQTSVQKAETSARNAEISARNADIAKQSAADSATKAEQSKKDIEDWRSYESKLQWGGEHLANKLSPLDTSLIASACANRFALMNPNYITWERSNDGGATWKLYSVSNANKIDVVTSRGTVSVADGNNTSVNNQLRVTFDIPPNTLYMKLQKLYVEFGSRGAKYEGKNGALCTVEIATYGTPDTFKKYVDTIVEGDDGFNVIQMNNTVGKQSTSETANPQHARKIRLTFKCDSLTSGRANTFCVRRIYAIAGTAWKTENNMQSLGTPYSVHNTGRADFPYPIKAPTFEGTSTRAIADQYGNDIANTYMKKSDAPSGGVVSLIKATMASASIDESMLYKVDGIYTVVVTLVLPHIYLSEHIKPTVVCIQPAEGNYYENTKSAIENGLKARKELINYGSMDGRTSYFLDIYSPNPFYGGLAFDVYYTVE